MILFTYIRLNFKDRCQCPRHFDFMFQQLLLEQLLQQLLLEQLFQQRLLEMEQMCVPIIIVATTVLTTIAET